MKKLLISLLAGVLILTACSKISKTSKDISDTDASIKNESIIGESPIKNPIKQVAKLDIQYKPNYKNIDLESDLSNICNLDAYMDTAYITEDIKNHLLKDGFYVDSTYGVEQPFQTYEFNEYLTMSSFVTTDSMVHLYHIFYDNMLRQVEEDKFLPMLKNLNSKMLESAIEDYNSAKDPVVKEAAKKNLILFSTGEFIIGDNLLKSDNNLKIDEKIFDLAKTEYNNILKVSPALSTISGDNLDYSQFKTRGHYTKNKNLETYFKLNMLYSQNKFYFYKDDTLNKENLIAGLLTSKNILKNSDLTKIYVDVVGTLDFLVEPSEKTDVIKMAAYNESYFKNISDVNKFNDDKKLEEIGEHLKNQKIEIADHKGNYFAVIPQKAPIDNKWAQKLVDSKSEISNKPIYKGIEIMALTGNKIADKLVKEDKDIKKWDKYPGIYEDLKKEVMNLDEDFWNKNLYRGYLSLIKEYSNTYGDGYPKFMQNENWNKKDLNSSLGLWAALKHDTILYAEAAFAEMGGGAEVEICNFVEPNIGLYERLDYLLNFTKENLTARDLLTEDQIKGFNNFISLNKFLIECSKSELDSSTLSKEANERLKYIGGEMENIFISFVNPNVKGFWEINDSSERDMAVVADIMDITENTWGLNQGDVQEVGLGYAHDMYVVYSLNGKVYLGRGPVLSYYEFQSDKRLNDEEFRFKIRDEQIKQLPFTNEYSYSSKY